MLEMSASKSGWKTIVSGKINQNTLDIYDYLMVQMTWANSVLEKALPVLMWKAKYFGSSSDCTVYVMTQPSRSIYSSSIYTTHDMTPSWTSIRSSSICTTHHMTLSWTSIQSSSICTTHDMTTSWTSIRLSSNCIFYGMTRPQRLIHILQMYHPWHYSILDLETHTLILQLYQLWPDSILETKYVACLASEDPPYKCTVCGLTQLHRSKRTSSNCTIPSMAWLHTKVPCTHCQNYQNIIQR